MNMTARIAFALFLSSAPSAASVDDAAYAAFAAGDYERAVVLAAEKASAKDYALAARAMNAEAYFQDGRKAARRQAGDALDLAEKAIALDPALPEAHLQAAISFGLRGAHMSPLRAFMSGMASKARSKIDDALALDPENAWALSTSGAWRIEVARRGGGAMYDADPEQGFAEFAKARALAPENLSIAYECALRLLADGREEWRETGVEALDAALALKPATQFERDLQARARSFKAAIDAGKNAEKAFIDAQP